MAGKDEHRIFVGGLSWDTTDRQLHDAFDRFGKVIEAQLRQYMVMLERDTGRPRGFGFVTFAEPRAMETAIDELHGRELNGRIISVNRAQPKSNDSEPGYYGGGPPSGGKGSYGGSDRGPPPGRSDCFKCGRPGHWARECPSGGGGGGRGRFPDRSRYSGGRGDRFGGDRYGDRFGGDRYGDRYPEDRYDGGRYGDRDRVDSRDRYGARDRYQSDRYPAGERLNGDRYAPTDRYPQNGYGKDRGYDREGGRSADRYGGGGPARYEGSYRERPGPYDRPARGARPPSFEDRY